MKKIALAIIVLFCACHSKNKSQLSEKNVDVVMFPFAVNTFGWKGIEKQNDALKERFMKQALYMFKNEHEIYRNDENAAPGYREKDFKDAFHIVDINNDGNDDFIYTGSTGGEGYEVAIILNTGKDFKIIFKQVQHIKKLELKDGKLFRLYLLDDGCCDDYLDFNQIYEVDNSSNVPKFNLIYLSSVMHGADLPKKYFKKPIYFEVLNNGYKLREDPVINDTTKSGVGGIEYLGNNIDTLNKGTTGRAISSKTDKTGRVWWFVEIDTTHTDHGDLFYEHSGWNSQRATKMGWISSRYVKKIDK